MKATTSQRIVLYLYRHRPYRESPVVPRSLVVEVIAREVGTSRFSVVRMLHALLREGVVDKRVAHVEGLGRRRRVFFLTQKGVTDA